MCEWTALLHGTSSCEVWQFQFANSQPSRLPKSQKILKKSPLTIWSETLAPASRAHLRTYTCARTHSGADMLPVTGAFSPACFAGWKCHYDRSHSWPSHNAAFERLNVSPETACMRPRARAHVHVCGGRGGIPESIVFLADERFNLPTSAVSLSPAACFFFSNNAFILPFDAAALTGKHSVTCQLGVGGIKGQEVHLGW